jgi:CRISPR-associated endonuclease/helicase Cas3
MKNPVALALAWVTYGHHGGLKDLEELRARLLEWAESPWPTGLEDELIPEPLLHGLPALPDWLKVAGGAGRHRFDLFVRMVFSILVDADFLDTEAYFAQAGSFDAAGRAQAREDPVPNLGLAWEVFQTNLRDLESQAGESLVNRLRWQVREACQGAAENAPGIFSLTVPTGGAKTLGSLAFGLRHALKHGHKRIIVAVPFTSVTEQTAAVFRAVLPPDMVLEHHSNLDPERQTALTRVASENWDAPVIVTTQVQLFESLLGNRPSRCRKVHNIAESVLILDEVQSLPAAFLTPILDVLDDLARHYGTTVLLTTATQPDLHARDLGGRRFQGLEAPPQEIIPGALASELWASLRRVRVHWPEDWGGDFRQSSAPWKDLSGHLERRPQVLVICHRKDDARALFQALRNRGFSPLHLSAAMCSAHRREVLVEVKARLIAGKPCHLVSTQLIEAGVDVDFPCVFRAMAGLEALAQSAGRCNRNGRLPDLGDFFIFEAPTEPPRDLVLNRDTTRAMRLSGTPDLLAPETFRSYFARLHGAKGDLLDACGLQADRAAWKFELVASKARLVDSPTETILVPFDQAAEALLLALRQEGPGRGLARRLQPYAVSAYPGQLKALFASGALESLHGFYVLRDPAFYHPHYGLHTEVDSALPLVL